MDSINNKLLIIGGSGFIGSHIAKSALKKGLHVTILSKNSKIGLNFINGVEYLFADVSSKRELNSQLQGKSFNYIVNSCGYIDHSNYDSGGNKVFEVHFEGTKNIIDCIDKKLLKSFIQIGSSDEYGNNPAPQNELQRESPISPYSCAKVASTHFLQTLYRTENFPVIILRPFLVYGPGQSVDRFIPQIVRGCINNETFPVSKGEQLRDFCFIDDFVRAVFAAFDNDEAYGEVINVSSGKPVSIKHVINTIVNIVGLGNPGFGEILYRKGENMALYGDNTKAKKILKWGPKVDLSSGIVQTINWVKGVY
jgi:nucleoside-diphosphate-sugar epimerase